MSLTGFLKKSTMFSHLPEADLQQLEASMTRRRYTAGQAIFHMGDEGGSLYIISKGRVKVAIPSREGEEIILAILSESEIMGELSLIDGKPRSATVSAIEDAEIYTLRREDFLEFLKTRFEAVLQVMEMLSQRLRETDASLAEAHFLDVRSRLAKKIVDLTRAFGVLKDGKIRIGIRITQERPGIHGGGHPRKRQQATHEVAPVGTGGSGERLHDHPRPRTPGQEGPDRPLGDGGRGLRAEGGGTEDRGRKAEGGGRRAEGGGLRAEDGRQRAEGGGTEDDHNREYRIPNKEC
ncbi:MAG: Crp/Fnr family transcriptional regulator [Deltaproteobacteria bacterium]|nr:Crp/Fnr family transcriptional regulator [Deltaproteobacteria bacterium]